MTNRRNTRKLERHPLRPLPLLIVSVLCLTWSPSAMAEDCGSPFTVTVEHTAFINTLVITGSGRVGINTTVPAATLQISSHVPEIRLNPTSSGSGKADLAMHQNAFLVKGNTDNSIVRIDTRSPLAMRIDAVGNVGLGTTVTTVPQAKLHVNGNVHVDGGTRILGDVALGSSRTLKTAFDAVDPAELLAKEKDAQIAELLARLTTVEQRLDAGPPSNGRQASGGLR